MSIDTLHPPLPAHAAAATPRAYLQEARCEFMRMLREPAFGIPVIVFPALFYLLFAVLPTAAAPAPRSTRWRPTACSG